MDLYRFSLCFLLSASFWNIILAEKDTLEWKLMKRRSHSHSEHSPEHPRPPIGPPPPEDIFKPLYMELKHFITGGDVTDMEAILTAVQVTLTRLKYVPYYDPSCRSSLRWSRYLHSSSASVYEMAQCIVNRAVNLQSGTSGNQSLSQLLDSERSFFWLCRKLLMSILEKARVPFGRLEIEMRNMTGVFEMIGHHYDRSPSFHSIKAPSSEVLRYEVETFANRFMCVTPETIKVLRREQVSSHDLEDLAGGAVIFKYLLYGYRFLKPGDLCPSVFLKGLFKRFGHSRAYLSPSDLDTLLKGDFPRPIGDKTQLSRSAFSANTNFIPVLEYPSGQGHSSHSYWQWNTHRNSDHSNNHFLKIDSPSNGFNLAVTDQCLSANHLISIFRNGNGGRSGTDPGWIDTQMLLDMCPALLSQLMNPQCHGPSSVFRFTTPIETAKSLNSNYTRPENNNDNHHESSSWKSYLFGSLAVTIISLCSLLGAVFIKLSNGIVKAYLMAAMLALAVGCLVADAVLHLLPEVLGSEEDGESDEGIFTENLKKLCALLASVYAFFVLELLLSKQHLHSHGADTGGNPQVKLVSRTATKETNLINNIDKTINNQLTATNSNGSNKSNQSTNSNDVNLFDASATERNKVDNSIVIDAIQRLDSNSSGSSDKSNSQVFSSSKSVAWMIIIGDAIHNFADGLAIGAAFDLSFTKGLSTSITVLCHEVPHELGDFAVLVSTGMSIQRAMALNFLSSLTAFAGLYAGLSLGSQEEATHWIFSVGAGMFLYVALTDLVPECKEYYTRKPNVKMFVGQNLGILIGYVAMLLLALYENNLEIKT